MEWMQWLEQVTYEDLDFSSPRKRKRQKRVLPQVIHRCPVCNNKFSSPSDVVQHIRESKGNAHRKYKSAHLLTPEEKEAEEQAEREKLRVKREKEAREKALYEKELRERSNKLYHNLRRALTKRKYKFRGIRNMFDPESQLEHVLQRGILSEDGEQDENESKEKIIEREMNELYELHLEAYASTDSIYKASRRLPLRRISELNEWSYEFQCAAEGCHKRFETPDELEHHMSSQINPDYGAWGEAHERAYHRYYEIEEPKWPVGCTARGCQRRFRTSYHLRRHCEYESNHNKNRAHKRVWEAFTGVCVPVTPRKPPTLPKQNPSQRSITDFFATKKSKEKQ